jgi:hypothetical protein
MDSGFHVPRRWFEPFLGHFLECEFVECDNSLSVTLAHAKLINPRMESVWAIQPTNESERACQVRSASLNYVHSGKDWKWEKQRPVQAKAEKVLNLLSHRPSGCAIRPMRLWLKESQNVGQIR